MKTEKQRRRLMNKSKHFSASIAPACFVLFGATYELLKCYAFGAH